MHLHFAEAMPCYLQQLEQDVMISEIKRGGKHGLITRLMYDYSFMTAGFHMVMLMVPYAAGNVWLLLVQIIFWTMVFGVLRGKYAKKKLDLVTEFLVLSAMYLFFLFLALSFGVGDLDVGETWGWLLTVYFFAVMSYCLFRVSMRHMEYKESALTAGFFILAMIYLFFICIAFIICSYVFEAILESSLSDGVIFLLSLAWAALYYSIYFGTLHYWGPSYNERKTYIQKGDIHGDR